MPFLVRAACTTSVNHEYKFCWIGYKKKRSNLEEDWEKIQSIAACQVDGVVLGEWPFGVGGKPIPSRAHSSGVCVCVCMERCGIVHCFGSTECTHIDQRNYWLLIVRKIILSYIKSVVTSPHSGWQLIMRAGLISPGSAERGFGSGCALILPIGVPMK